MGRVMVGKERLVFAGVGELPGVSLYRVHCVKRHLSKKEAKGEEVSLQRQKLLMTSFQNPEGAGPG